MANNNTAISWSFLQGLWSCYQMFRSWWNPQLFWWTPPCPWRSAWEDLPIPRLWHGASFRILQGDNGDLIELTRHLNLTNINQPKSGSSSLNVVISLKLINENGDLNSKQQGFNCWTCSFKGDFTKANIDIYVSRRNCDIKNLKKWEVHLERMCFNQQMDSTKQTGLKHHWCSNHGGLSSSMQQLSRNAPGFFGHGFLWVSLGF